MAPLQSKFNPTWPKSVRTAFTYPFVDDVAGDDRGQQTGQVGQTVGQAHQYAGESRRYVQMVDFESRVYGAVESDAHGQYGHGQVWVAARVGRRDQRYRRPELTCGHEETTDGVKRPNVGRS